MAQLHNQDDEWGYLLRMQAEKARQEEIELKQEEEMRRRKYKYQMPITQRTARRNDGVKQQSQ